MKKITLIFILIIGLFASQAKAQAPVPYNPFTQNIHFTPEPTAAGFECNTTQTVVFTQGLTTAADATQWQSNPLTVIICLTGFTYTGSAASIVSGSYSSNFDWAFDSFAPNCIVGTQKQTLPGTGGNPISPNPLSSGEIKLTLTVPETSPIATVLAVNVNLQVPGYMSQYNSAPDDNESVQTQSYCPLKIRGAVHNDRNNDNNVNDIYISAPDGVALYAHLVDPIGTLIATTPIDVNGRYEFSNITPFVTYSVTLGLLPGTLGLTSPASDLPGTWVNTGEDCCDMVGTDGNANGAIVIPVTNASKVNVEFGIKDPTATGLPLVVKNFFVSEYNCAALLSWTTVQEDNTSHVDIYRKDGSQGSYRKIATVLSAGVSKEEKIYSYIDKDVSSDNVYEYQLKFVDIDAQVVKSEIKSLTLDCSKQSSSINTFPNPATSELNVLYVTEADNASLDMEIVDITGRKIMEKSQVLNNGGNVITFDVQHLAAGTYILHYKDQEALTSGSVKFTKQ